MQIHLVILLLVAVLLAGVVGQNTKCINYCLDSIQGADFFVCKRMCINGDIDEDEYD